MFLRDDVHPVQTPTHPTKYETWLLLQEFPNNGASVANASYGLSIEYQRNNEEQSLFRAKNA